MRIFIIAMVAAGLASCADTGPVKIGKDTYTISVRVPLSGQSGAKGEALAEATTYCSKLGKHLLLQNETSSECALHGGCGEAQITFLCLDENDARYSGEH